MRSTIILILIYASTAFSNPIAICKGLSKENRPVSVQIFQDDGKLPQATVFKTDSQGQGRSESFQVDYQPVSFHLFSFVGKDFKLIIDELLSPDEPQAENSVLKIRDISESLLCCLDNSFTYPLERCLSETF